MVDWRSIMAKQRTDLAQESHELWQESAGTAARLPGVQIREGNEHGFAVHRTVITEPQGAKALGKPTGTYVTIELDGLLRREEDAFSRAALALSTLLEPMLPPAGDALVVGLGNRAITPDLVGPLSADRTLVTRHLVEQLPGHFGSFRPVAALTPGVLASTGMESALLVRAAAEQLHPACVIAIDALVSRSAARLCRTVQLSDTGIVPGSGVGNHRMALNEETLGVPVISVGVPTVVEASTLIMDLLGAEDDNVPGADLFVTPREVDSRVSDLSRVIGYGISMALNPGLTVEDLDMLLA